MTDLDIFEVFNLPRRAEAPEHLAVMQQYYEVTINIKQDKMTLLEHINVYKNVWAHLKNIYNIKEDLYFIEYCKSGQPHLHGYVRISYPINAMQIDDEHFLRDISKTVFKLLPKKYWKQHVNAKYFPSMAKLISPALCLNMKNYLSTNWVDYIKKNAV